MSNRNQSIKSNPRNPTKAEQAWRTWAVDKKYGDILQKRARGELPEMESAKATALKMKRILRPRDSILDVGCGSGHYFRTLQRLIKTPFFYTGMDATSYYIQLAQETFSAEPNVCFAIGDAMKLPYASNSFDVVMSTNLLLHLPSIVDPLSEMVRVARRSVLIRTLIGNRSFIVKEVKPGSESDPGDEFTDDHEPRSYSYFNIYSKKYIKRLISRLSDLARFEIVADRSFNARKIDADKSMEVLDSLKTRTIGQVQVLGYLLLPWAFIKIDKK